MKRSGGARITKEHHSGTQLSSSPVSINIVSPCQCWCDIEQIPFATCPVIVWSTIDYQYIWIAVGGLSVTYKVELITRLDYD